LEGIVVHLESVLSHTPRSWQGSHSSGDAARAVAVLHQTPRRSWGYAVLHRTMRCFWR